MHVVLLALVWGFTGFQDDKPDTYGKSEAQILAMGQTKWDAFYSKKAGDSTMAMVEMNGIYGEAMAHRNDRLLKAAPKIKQIRIGKLRKLLNDFGSHATDLGYNIGGGGTMWSPISAQIETDTETVVYALLGGKTAKPKSASPASLKHEMALLAKTVADTHADKDSATYFHYDQAKTTLHEMKAMVPVFVAFAKEYPGANGVRVLRFGVDYAGLARNEWN